ncbi:hypothetical protein FACS1894189_2460 [Planctomycetales bacterium]|nr:hypothetical protein FACS1894189_2460 [Planctomycetales bacterium]
MNCSRNFRLLVAFVAVSFLVVGTVVATTNKICLPGIVTTVEVSSSEMLLGYPLLTTISTVVREDAVCADVEFTSTCNLGDAEPHYRQVILRTSVTPAGNISWEPVITESGSFKKC